MQLIHIPIPKAAHDDFMNRTLRKSVFGIENGAVDFINQHRVLKSGMISAGIRYQGGSVENNGAGEINGASVGNGQGRPVSLPRDQNRRFIQNLR